MGKCGGGGGTPPQASGVNEDFFALIPDLMTVRVDVPDTFEDTVVQTGMRRRVIASCGDRQNESFDVRGVGVWVSLRNFGHDVVSPDITRSSIKFTCTQQTAWRHRDRVDTASLCTNHPDTTVLLVIDMDSGALLSAQHGSKTVGAHMTDVIRLAQANGMHIFEVFCAKNRTHQSLRDVIEKTPDGENYPHRRSFDKPGTGGACDANCLELDTRTPCTTRLRGFTTAIVMGFDGSICVGRSIFGGWRNDRVIAPVDGLEQHTLREQYEPGLLDNGLRVVTSWTVCICGSAGGPLVSAYLKYRED